MYLSEPTLTNHVMIIKMVLGHPAGLPCLIDTILLFLTVLYPGAKVSRYPSFGHSNLTSLCIIII